MADMKKVKNGLECLARKQKPTANPCKGCGYNDMVNFAFCVVEIASDALELLKEQQHTIWELQETNEYLKDKADRMMRNLQAVLEEREET